MRNFQMFNNMLGSLQMEVLGPQNTAPEALIQGNPMEPRREEVLVGEVMTTRPASRIKAFLGNS